MQGANDGAMQIALVYILLLVTYAIWYATPSFGGNNFHSPLFLQCAQLIISHAYNSSGNIKTSTVDLSAAIEKSRKPLRSRYYCY